MFGGWLGDRFGARRTLCVSLLIVCVATALTGAVGGLASLFSMRLALGFGEGAALPTATHAMTRWIPEARWGFAQNSQPGERRLSPGPSREPLTPTPLPPSHSGKRHLRLRSG